MKVRLEANTEKAVGRPSANSAKLGDMNESLLPGRVGIGLNVRLWGLADARVS